MKRFIALCACAALCGSTLMAGISVQVFPRSFEANVDGTSQLTIKRIPAGEEFLLEVNKGQDVSYYAINWYKDGTQIEGQHTQRLQYNGATPDMNGVYTVTMTSPCATATSQPMRVIVGSTPFPINTRIGVAGGTNETTVAPFALHDAKPNPVTDKTKITFSTTDNAHIDLRVIDLNGRVVATLVSEPLTAGEHDVMLNTNAFNMAEGLYYIVLSSPGFTISKPLVIN